MKKKIISFIMVGLLICLAPTTAFAGTWEQDMLGYWTYLKDNGSSASNEWVYDNGSWYHFNEHGTMAVNVINKIGGYDYYFCSSGKMAFGGFMNESSNGERIFADKDGHVVEGLLMVDGVLYDARAAFMSNSGTYDLVNVGFDKPNGEKMYITCMEYHGKVLDKDGKPFVANSKVFTQIKYLPKYDSKGNLIGAIKN